LPGSDHRDEKSGHPPWPGVDRRQPGDRRSGRDRRSGQDRRQQSLGPPTGIAERRGGADRRRGERRSGCDRRSEEGWLEVPVEDLESAPFEGEPALVDAARAARERARAPFSGFKVGAALETVDGRIITGCNIENASYGLTVCAERVALLKALSEGHEIFTRIAVVADTIRQLLWEYCGDLQVILASLEEVGGRYQLSRLLPMPFDRRLLSSRK
jgi:cytidine deaminase